MKTAGLAHPVREEMQAEAGVAEVDEVRARVGQREHARLVPEERRHARVVVLEELRDHLRVERLVAEKVERILAGGELRQRHAVHLDLAPVAGEEHA